MLKGVQNLSHHIMRNIQSLNLTKINKTNE